MNTVLLDITSSPCVDQLCVWGRIDPRILVSVQALIKAIAIIMTPMTKRMLMGRHWRMARKWEIPHLKTLSLGFF